MLWVPAIVWWSRYTGLLQNLQACLPITTALMHELIDFKHEAIELVACCYLGEGAFARP